MQGDFERDLRINMLRTELMIDAIACGQQGRFSDFDQQKLKDYADVKRRLDLQLRDRGMTDGFEGYSATLMQQVADRCVGDMGTCCKASGYLFDAALAPGVSNLADFTANLAVAQRHGFRSCNPPATLVAYGPDGTTTTVAADAGSASPVPAPVAPEPTSSGPGDVGNVPVPKPKPAKISR